MARKVLFYINWCDFGLFYNVCPGFGGSEIV